MKKLLYVILGSILIAASCCERGQNQNAARTGGQKTSMPVRSTLLVIAFLLEHPTLQDLKVVLTTS
jgi:hypothetical protein